MRRVGLISLSVFLFFFWFAFLETSGTAPNDVAQRTYAAYDANDRVRNSASPANGQVSLRFDANGNTLQFDLDGSGGGSWDQAEADAYNLENRLIEATRSGGTLFITYDGDDNRVKKITPEGTTYYLVDDRNPTGYAQVLEEQSSPGGTPTVTYTYGLDLISQSRGEVVYYYGYDANGNTRLLTGSDGQITDAYYYDAFGILMDQRVALNEQLVALNTSSAPPATPNNYLYSGEQWDKDLGLYYLRARYYHPETGRFWTMDTFEGHQADPLSLHKYLYAHADPVNNVDPSGLYPESLGSLMFSASKIGYFAANLGIRSITVLTRATVLIFEAATGNTVFIGGSWRRGGPEGGFKNGWC